MLVEFMFSQKATKIHEISSLDLTLVNVKSKVEISSNFLAFLENLNFYHNYHLRSHSCSFIYAWNIRAIGKSKIIISRI